MVLPQSRDLLAILRAAMSSAPTVTATEHFNKTAEKYEAATGGGTRELAQHAISLAAGVKPLTSESKILDNACGTGIVTDTILQSSGGDMQPEVHAVDCAGNMVAIARDRFSAHHNVQTAIMPGEQLSFPDNTFTHSFTNLGLMYFTDAEKGAREIARTLRPDGVAVVTGWAAMGPIAIIREVQARVRPGDAPFRGPLADIWLDPEHTKAVLSGAGLDVQTSTAVDVHLGGETADGVADFLIKGFGLKLFESWSEEEKEEGAQVMKNIVREQVVPFTRPSGSGVGIKLTGTIFIACKGT